MRNPALILILTSGLLIMNPQIVQPFPIGSNIEKQDDAPQKQSPELAEADELSQQVVDLYKNGKYDAALPLALRVIALREKALGSDHPLVADALANLAEIYMAKAKTNEAKSYFQRAIAIREKNPGTDNTVIVKNLERYMCLLANTGKKDEVFEVRKRLFKLNNGIDSDESYKPIRLPYPAYPAEAKSKRISGAVLAKITIDETGKVIDAKALCGDPVLVRAIGAAVWKAQFKARIAPGAPARIVDIITYYFLTAN